MKYIKLLNNSVLHYGIIVSIRLKTKARQKQRNAHKGNGYGAKLSILNLLMPLAKSKYVFNLEFATVCSDVTNVTNHPDPQMFQKVKKKGQMPCQLKLVHLLFAK